MIREMLDSLTGGYTDRRYELATAIYKSLTPDERERFRLEECGDEHTGQRYGNRDCRRNRSKKIGGGGRNRGSRYAYQIWAVWS